MAWLGDTIYITTNGADWPWSSDRVSRPAGYSPSGEDSRPMLASSRRPWPPLVIRRYAWGWCPATTGRSGQVDEGPTVGDTAALARCSGSGPLCVCYHREMPSAVPNSTHLTVGVRHFTR